jgi:hypothetical protein
MPTMTQSFRCLSRDWKLTSITVVTHLGQQKVLFTVGLSISLEEAASDEGALTMSTHKVFWMPLLIESSDAISLDGLVASRTSWSIRTEET